MSVRAREIMALASVKLAKKPDKELQGLFKKTINNSMHGLCFSPYGEGQSTGDPISETHSLLYMKEMYSQATSAANGKKVIVTESGWPNQGTNFESVFPSHDNAMKYFINAQQWSKKDNINMFYFSSFDES